MKMAGMPMHWKVVSLVFVTLPKMLLWIFTLRCGVLFIMETADIDNVVVNATALGFILNIDELLFECVTNPQTRYMLRHMECVSASPSGDSCYSSHLQRPQEDANELIERSEVRRTKLSVAIPVRLLACVAITLVLLTEYYTRKCMRTEDGVMVSVPMHLPKSTNYNLLSAFFPVLFPFETEEEPFWTPQESYHVGKR
jgi:hypothetical protein